MLKVMLDTNVLIKLTFIITKKHINKPSSKPLEKYKIILDKLEQSKFFNVMSLWNRFELSDVLMRLKLAEVYLLSGFTVDEFTDAKEEKIELSKEDTDKVNDIVFEIWKFCERKTLEMNMRKIQIWANHSKQMLNLE